MLTGRDEKPAAAATGSGQLVRADGHRLTTAPDGKVTFVEFIDFESAAQQGQFEAMFQKMFATQLEWGEKKVPVDDTFRGFAPDLKLDMAAYDKAYDSADTLNRIRQDAADGKALGVTGTPTFLNGKMFEPTSYDHIVQSFDAALAG